MEVLKLSEIREVDDDSNYIGEVPEEMEVTTSGQKTGFRSGMKLTGLMKTGAMMKTTLKSTTKLSAGSEHNQTQT